MKVGQQLIKIQILFIILFLFTNFTLDAQTVVGEDITLEWNDNSENEDGFCIEYTINSSGTWNILDSVDANITQYGAFSFTQDDTLH